MRPLEKKWVYHFMVSPKTNIIDKPEWYLGQTLKWIYENIDTVESKIKLDSSEEAKCPHVKHKFILFMLELAMRRLTKDMNDISKLESEVRRELVLVHTYNEVIQFVKVIRQLLGDCYLNMDEKYDLLLVFANQELFEELVTIEWEYAEKNLKDITKSPTRWEPVLEGEFADTYKIPRCVDRLLMLTNSITERVQCFRQLDCQFKLIELQCHLLIKFLSFLKKSTSSSGISLAGLALLSDDSSIDMSRISQVFNGVNFLRLVLKERFFLPSNLIDNLDKTLLDKANKLTRDYQEFFDKLVNFID